jgi:hypothetical protein
VLKPVSHNLNRLGNLQADCLKKVNFLSND